MPLINNKPVGPLGYGCMGLSIAIPSTPDSQCFEALTTALNAGCNFWNSADFYGHPPDLTANLALLTRYFTAHPAAAEKVILSVKGGFDIINFVPRGDRASIHSSIDNILQLLDGKKFLDIFTPARIDQGVPVEETVAAIAEYVKAGKIGGIGLSEASAATIRRAHKVHPISYVELEVSLWSREIFAPGGISNPPNTSVRIHCLPRSAEAVDCKTRLPRSSPFSLSGCRLLQGWDSADTQIARTLG